VADSASSEAVATPAEKKPSRRRKLIIWSTVILLAAIPAVWLWNFLGSPEFCNKCHEMQPAVQGWSEAPHGANGWATCLDCHADPGFFGELRAHLNGARYLSVHLSDPPDPQEISGTVKPEWCVACHAEAWDDAAFAREHPTKDAPCGVCHRDKAHANENPYHPTGTEEEGGES
jgi:cytochrome c nitrite reductase small subunit